MSRRMSRPGDWSCGVCQYMNFQWREACQHCLYPKIGGPDPSTYEGIRTAALAGDWFCKCGAHNYASRANCYTCQASKNDNGAGNSVMPSAGGYGSDSSPLPGWKPGDWICNRVGCGEHNYAIRIECHICKTPKDYGQ